ncbi:MAG TPA: YbaB/EbfC family nucleoid-associated protein [Propionibacteriaceae bacterium]|nr:YbaB/EbfC family nucleoid-associated protein [Propionibacteriaceae bacterium]
MSSFSDWIGAQDLRDASMGLDDPALADRTAALVSRNEVLLAESERLDKTLADLKTALTETRGEGEAESGAVKVIVDAQNRVVDIVLTPKALRLGSTDRLRAALLEACDAAVADAASTLREATGVDEDRDPMDAFFDGLPEIKALMPLAVRVPRQAPRPDPADPEENDG